MNQLPYLNVPKPIPTKSPTGKRTLFPDLDNKVKSVNENADNARKVLSCLREVEQSANYETINDDQSDQTARRTLFSEIENENVKENIDDVVSSLQEKVAELLSANKKLNVGIEKLKAENEQQKTEIGVLTKKLEEEGKSKYFSVETFMNMNNDSLFRFYTGIQDYKTFKIFLDSFMPAAKNLVYYGSKTCAERLVIVDVVKHGPKRCLTPEQEFFLALVRLRLGLMEVDLATRAGVSQSQISRVFITWVDFLYSRLRIPIWPTRESVDFTMPTAFKELYPTTRVIIDCSELFIETPSSFRSQSAAYSSYKHHNTAKGLVGINPSGAVKNCA